MTSSEEWFSAHSHTAAMKLLDYCCNLEVSETTQTAVALSAISVLCDGLEDLFQEGDHTALLGTALSEELILRARGLVGMKPEVIDE